MSRSLDDARPRLPREEVAGAALDARAAYSEAVAESLEMGQRMDERSRQRAEASVDDEDLDDNDPEARAPFWFLVGLLAAATVAVKLLQVAARAMFG